MVEIKFHMSPDWDWCVATVDKEIDSRQHSVVIYQVTIHLLRCCLMF